MRRAPSARAPVTIVASPSGMAATARATPARVAVTRAPSSPRLRRSTIRTRPARGAAFTGTMVDAPRRNDLGAVGRGGQLLQGGDGAGRLALLRDADGDVEHDDRRDGQPFGGVAQGDDAGQGGCDEHQGQWFEQMAGDPGEQRWLGRPGQLVGPVRREPTGGFVVGERHGRRRRADLVDRCRHRTRPGARLVVP